MFPATSDPSVQIGVGWQGPYLRLGAGSGALKDGWGKSFQCRKADGSFITGASTVIAEVRSLASDGLADPGVGGTGGTDGYALDVAVSIPANNLGGAAATFKGSVKRFDPAGLTQISPPAPGELVDASDPAQGMYQSVTVTVNYFGPDVVTTPGVAKVASVPVTVISPWNYQLTGDSSITPTAGIAQAQDNRITIGPRVLKAYMTYTTTLGGPAVTVSSAALSVVGLGGRTNRSGSGPAQSLTVLLVPESRYMPTFSFTARDAAGQWHNGTQAADSPGALAVALRARSLSLIKAQLTASAATTDASRCAGPAAQTRNSFGQ